MSCARGQWPPISSRALRRKRLEIPLALVVFLASAMAGQTATQSRLRYRVVEIPLKPWHLSNSGQAAGKTSKNQAAIWNRRRGLRLLPTIEGFSESEARGSNASGYVVGFATNSDQVGGFTYEKGKLVRLPGKNSKALAVNDAGEVVGESEIEGKAPVVPALWNHQQVTSLGGCCGGVARGINNRGQIIGDLYDQAGRYRAFLWDSVHGIQSLGPASGYSSAIAINDAGHVLLQEPERGVSVYRSPDATVHIEIPDHQPGDGRAINNAAEVVGAFGPYFDADHAFLWTEKDGFRDLNDLIPAGSGWKLQVATGINDRGEIVGFGSHSGEDAAGFLLIPQRK
jgi:probable HAF family extracellular repeat protein